MKQKIALGLGALATTLAVLPLFAAFEAHVINVTARIENALLVPVEPIAFGTVFPQEHLERNLPIALSESFIRENRVDDVEYMIRQKPKCGWTYYDGHDWILVGETHTGHVVPTLDNSQTPLPIDESNGGTAYTVDCGQQTPQPTGGNFSQLTWGQLPMLCPYLSKHENTNDGAVGTVVENDTSLNSFHHPFDVINSSVVWNDTAHGKLTKIGKDTDDNWVIDLSVPCFGGYCAQDWLKFVQTESGNQNMTQAEADSYTQPISNEHKIFGCDLWVEVTGVSRLPN